MKEKTYLWHGISSNGKRIHGEIQADSLIKAKELLNNQEIYISKIKLKLSLHKNKAISSKHIADFSRQLATLVNSGIPLLTAISIIQQSNDHPTISILLGKIKQDIEQGLSLSAALSKYPHLFDELFCNLVYAGEQSGTLDIMLNNIASYKEKSESLKRKIKKALFYPLAVLIIAIIVTVILLTFVVPQFATLFHGFGAELPAYTQLIITLSYGIKNNGWPILTIIIFLFFTFKISRKKISKFSIFLDKIILHLPFFGNLIKKSLIARFTSTLAITFSAGLPLSEALLIIANSVGNKIYHKAIIKIQQDVIAGQTITSSISNNPLFPTRATQLITIGEESGSLDSMLSKIAAYYEEEVNHIVSNLNNLLEPAIMVILGILIGGLIIGMYLPIFKLGTVL